MKATIENIVIDQSQNGTYIVLEAGPTHSGIDSAKELAKMAKEAGANAVKYQLLYADRLMAKKDVLFSYKYLQYDADGKEEFIEFTEPLYDVLKRRELEKEEWKELKAYCDSLGLTMFTTATYKDEVDFIIDELGIDSIKINSGDVNDLEFIKYCASKNVSIQLDTGNADIWEIERAVIEAEEAGCTNIIIHMCPSGYPTKLESVHLRMITTLKNMFPNYSIAFSDHSPGWDMDIAAVALGADMIEKTITLDRTTKSCEHSFSLEKEDAKRFVESIRDVETAMGSYRRTIPSHVREKRKLGRRSPYALVDLKKGDVINVEDFEFKRPGVGVTSAEFDFFIGKELTTDIPKGTAITYDNI
ncbi:N-acetylneuraminate synthase family protein [Aureispira anguillae]|uniref:N-acetylneuraminate synthase family protein n=1 Tax=Aureispira anguillae TaxID=2864201 RepID=A0A915YKA6_9BACT|nr:N-acetylneuraminate synthase family protein [Aureispira anguillae]BDS14373.1 N-acetylneuraminate synthase family protein [Aureispira anguillae]